MGVPYLSKPLLKCMRWWPRPTFLLLILPWIHLQFANTSINPSTTLRSLAINFCHSSFSTFPFLDECDAKYQETYAFIYKTAHMKFAKLQRTVYQYNLSPEVLFSEFECVARM